MPVVHKLSSGVARALGAGAIGTAAFDLWLYARYRQRGGDSRFADWESSAGLSSWDAAPAPALLGKRAIERVTGHPLAPTHARLVNNVMHWGYGIGNALQYAILARRMKQPRIRYGLAFGAAVWGADYVILPILKLYKPIWRYDAKTLADDLCAHLIYGLATATALRVLDGH